MFGWIVIAAQWIWNGVQAAAVLTVHALSIIAGYLWAGLKAAGSYLSGFGKAAWRFFRNTWDHVLKPAWQKFFKFVDRIHDRLERIFGPVLRKINAIRTFILGFWKRFIRPILDAIDIARSVLRVLAQLGIDWAKRLDSELARIQAAIEKPLLEIIRRLNEVANWINRIVDLDGLFQKLVFVRSLERDAREVSRTFVNWRHRPIDPNALPAIREKANARTLADVENDIREALLTGRGQNAALRAEIAATFANALRR